MSEFKESLPPEEKPPTEAELSRSLQRFREALKGWHTSPDGEDFCPDHWGVYLNQFDKQQREWVKSDSRRTKQFAQHRKSLDGWMTMCQYEGKDKTSCERSVYVPYQENLRGVAS